MKNNQTMVLSLINMMTRTLTANKGDKMVFAENLPMAAKFFVQEHFPHQAIAYVEKNNKANSTMYEVFLNDGTMVGFNENGCWSWVDCKTEAVPAALIPELVSQYMAASHVNNSVVRIDKTGNGYEFALSNDVVMKLSGSYVA